MLRVEDTRSGFTIVELLVVIVVIAILAVVAVVSYVGIQNRAHDTAVQHDLETIAKKYELYKIDSGSGLYPYGATLNNGDAFRLAIARNSYEPTSAYQLLNCTNITTPGIDYAILAVSKSGNRYYVGSDTGGVKLYTGGGSWISSTGVCSSVLVDSVGNGAGYGSNVWRTWTSTN